MFKNRLDAAKQLKEKLEPDLGPKKEIKIIALTSGGKKIAAYLKKLLKNSYSSTISHQSSIIIVDDGSISVDKLIHAVKLYRKENAQKIIAAIPVYKLENILKLQEIADAVYAIYQPKAFISPEEFYQDLE